MDTFTITLRNRKYRYDFDFTTKAVDYLHAVIEARRCTIGWAYHFVKRIENVTQKHILLDCPQFREFDNVEPILMEDDTIVFSRESSYFNPYDTVVEQRGKYTIYLSDEMGITYAVRNPVS